MTDAAVLQATDAPAGPSAGTLLRRAREAAGLHVAALAVSLKVPVRKLEALEADRIDELPDAVFTRALASSVCRALKIDPQPVLERLPQGSAPRLVQDRDGINTPFRVPGEPAAPGWRDHFRRPPVLVASGLVLAAGVLLVWPIVQGLIGTTPASSRPATTVEPVPVSAPAPALAGLPAEPAVPATAAPVPAAPAPLPVVAAAAAVQPPSMPAQAAAAGAAQPAPAPVPASPAAAAPAAAATAAAAADSGQAAPAATGVVVFTAKGPSWIQVVDARGAVPLRRLLAAGEQVGASGALPLAVTIGSAETTQVQVRGKPFDLAPVTRDNVARFEVK